MREFDYEHQVCFEETNLVGNVYFVNYLRWQGRCREQFLVRHCPDVVTELERDLALVTTRCTCEFLEELRAFDRVRVRMSLTRMTHNRLTMAFSYWRIGSDPVALVATGEQQVAFMLRTSAGLVPTPIPAAVRSALGRHDIAVLEAPQVVRRATS